MNYTQEENLIIQSYFTISLLTELKNNNFLQSDYFRNMNFGDQFIKNSLPSVGIDNQGTLVLFMYVLLVLPKKQIEKVLPNEIARLNYFLKSVNVNSISTYKGEEESMNYISHIINSVSKGEVEYSQSGSVIFTNENKETGENCFIEIPLIMVGNFLTEIQRTFMFYIEQLKIKYSK